MSYSRFTILLLAVLLVANSYAQKPRLKGLRRPPEKIRIELTVDGTDKIFVQGNALWIEHEEYELPGNIKVSGRKWNPQWNDNVSDRFTQVDPAFEPYPGTAVNIRKSKGRGTVSIIQKPDETNGFTVCIRVNDAEGGADHYKLVLSFEK